MKLIFIRHAQTEANVLGLIHKTNDNAGLDDVGKLQAAKTGLACQSLGVEAVYSSSEARAVKTAEIITQQLGIGNKVITDLQERKWGEWAGKPWDEIKARLDQKEITERYIFIPPGGESWQQMETRLKQALATITSGSEKVVAIVMHNGTLRSLIPLISGKPLSASITDNFKNCSITIFDYDGTTYAEILFNSIDHLS